MFKKFILPLGMITFTTGYYLHYQKVDLHSPHLHSILNLLHTQNPAYSSFVLKNMIRFCMVKQCQKMKGCVFSEGFDFDAGCLKGLVEIGFDTVEVGPVALIPSCAEEERLHFGSKIAIANINTFHEERKLLASQDPLRNSQDPQGNSQNHQGNSLQPLRTKIGVSITPNFQIVKYAPYLIQQNMLYCLKEFQQLNQGSPTLQIHRYILRLTQPDLKQLQTPQYLTLVKQLITKADQSLEQTLQKNTKQLSPQSHNKLSKPEIFVQIPNRQENQKVFDLVKSLKQVKNLIIDKAEYEVHRETVNKGNKKIKNNVEHVQLTIGKRRITFDELLDKVVNDTL